MGKAPHHQIIAVRDKLQNPSAVLLQKKQPSSTKTAFDTLIFVYDDNHNGSKVIIKMDIQTQVKTGKKTREKILLNRVTTGSKSTIEGVKALENTELFYGKL